MLIFMEWLVAGIIVVLGTVSCGNGLILSGRDRSRPDPQSAASTQGRLHLSTASEKFAPHDRFNHQNVDTDVALPEYANKVPRNANSASIPSPRKDASKEYGTASTCHCGTPGPSFSQHPP